jgi:hypothetical protein
MLSLRSILSPLNDLLWRDKMLRKLSMTGGVLLLPYPYLPAAGFAGKAGNPAGALRWCVACS